MSNHHRSQKDILFVSVQALLFCIYLFRIASMDFQVTRSIQYTGLATAIIGALVIAHAIILLGKNLTPFPSPKENSTLIIRGLYKYIRHPIYSGIILFSLGYGFYSENGLRLIVSVLLFLLFTVKAKYEERLLSSKFPSYNDYILKTKMFFPRIF